MSPVLCGCFRKIDSANQITQLILDVESQSRSQLSARDALGVLDFPGEEELDANVRNGTSLSRADLLQRAAQSPGQLTAPELDLLRARCWLDTTADELWARAVVAEALASVSGGSWDETKCRLQAVRGPLYRLHEPEAFDNAEMEYVKARGRPAHGDILSTMAQTPLMVSIRWMNIMCPRMRDCSTRGWRSASLVNLTPSGLSTYSSGLRITGRQVSAIRRRRNGTWSDVQRK